MASALSAFYIWVEVAGGAGVTADFDCLYLVPIDEWYLDLTCSAQLSAQDQIIIDGLLPQPSIYVRDSTGVLQPELVTPSGNYALERMIEPGRDNRWFVIALRDDALETASGHDLTDVFTLTFDYHPLYHRFRTA